MKAHADAQLARLPRGLPAFELCDGMRKDAVAGIQRQATEGRLMDELDADE